MDPSFIHPSVATPTVPQSAVQPVVTPPAAPAPPVAPASAIGFQPVADVRPAQPIQPAPAVLPVVESAPSFSANQFTPPPSNAVPTPIKRAWKRGTTMRLVVLSAAMVLVTTGAAYLFKQGQTPGTGGTNRGVVVPEQDLGSEVVLTEFEGEIPEEQTLIVNGDIRLQGALNFRSGSYLGSFVQGNLTGNQTYTLPDASGEICVSSNNCEYLTAAQLVATGLVTQQQLAQAQSTLVTAAQLSDLQQQLSGIVVTAPNYTGGAGISIVGETIQNSGVLTLNGQSGALTLTGGSGILVSGTTLSNTGVLTVNGQSGAVAFTGGTGISLSGTTINNDGVLSLGGQTGALNLVSGPGISISGLTISNNGVTSTQGLTGNVVFTAGGGIDITGTNISNTGVTLLTGTANQISVSAGTGSVTLSLPQDIAVASTPTFAGLTLSGALTANTITPTSGLTIGSTSQALTLQGSTTQLTATSGANTVSLTFQSPTANVIYRFSTAAAGTYDICTTTGNCSGVGGGVTTPGGTAGTIPKFTSSQGLGDSNITDDGTTVTINGNFDVTGVINGQLVSPDAHFTGNVTVDLDMTIGGTLTVDTIDTAGAMTIGNTGQSLLLQGSAVTLSNTDSGITNSLVFATPSGSNKTITIPNMSGTICLTSGNCAGVGGTGDVLQGGNSFATAMTIGTNDNFALNFETNGATVMTILTNGNVGINTTTPADKFQIKDGDASITGTGANFFFRGPQAGNVGHAGFFDFNLLTNGLARLTVKASGEVGIGTSSAVSQLELSQSNTTADRQRLTLTNTAVGGYGSVINFRARQNFGTNDIVDAAQIKVDGQNNYGTSGSTSSYMAFSTIFQGALGERLRIMANGNVGIGTTSADAKLHVSAGAALLDNTYGYQIKNNANTAIYVLQMDASNHLSLGATSGMGNLNLNAGTGSISLATSAGTAMTILNGGNVGVGSANPQSKFEVSGGHIRVVPSTTSAYIGFGSADGVSGFTAGRGVTAQAHQFEIYDNTAGQTRLFVNSSGDVGVGNTNPGSRLHVTTSSSVVAQFERTGSSAPSIRLVSSGSSYSQITNLLTNALQMGPNGQTDALLINSSGNVGIGNTSPNYKLDVGGTVNISSQLRATNMGLYIWGTDVGGTNRVLTGSTNIESQDGDGMEIGTSGAAPLVFYTGTTERMRILSGGSVGIGISSGLNGKLDVGVAHNNNALSITNTTVSKSWIFYPYTNGTNTDMRFYETNTAGNDTRVTFQAGGNVGIGSTSPTAKLHVVGAQSTGHTSVAKFIDEGGWTNDGSATVVIQQPGNYAQTAILSVETSAVNNPNAIIRLLQAGTGKYLTATNGTTEVAMINNNGSIYSVNDLRAQYGTAAEVLIGNTGSLRPGLIFGSSADTNLYRSAASILKTDDVLWAQGSDISGTRATVLQLGAMSDSPVNTLFKIQVADATDELFMHSERWSSQFTWSRSSLTGNKNSATLMHSGAASYFDLFSGDDTANNIRIRLNAGGAAANPKLEFADTAGNVDTNLYRSAANTLKTDDRFFGAQDIAAYDGDVRQVWLDTGSTNPGIRFGNGLDTNLYRSAADTLRTDDAFEVGGTLRLSATSLVSHLQGAADQTILATRFSGEANNRFTVTNRGVLLWGDGTSSPDTTLYRPAADMLRTDDAMLIQPTGGSATALQVRDNSSVALLTADTTNLVVKVGTTGSASLAGTRLLATVAEVTTTLRIGDGTNGVEFSGSGTPVYRGTARPTRRIALAPEFSGMVLSASGGSNTGTMTAGYDSTNYHNYYNWTTAQVTNQNYDLVLRIPVPQDYSALTASPQLCLYGYTTDTTNGLITVSMRDSANAAVTLSSSSFTPGSTSAWTETCRNITGTPTITAGGWITVTINMQAPQSGNTRVGELRMDYLGGF